MMCLGSLDLTDEEALEVVVDEPRGVVGIDPGAAGEFGQHRVRLDEGMATEREPATSSPRKDPGVRLG